jgi:hypothetical protein
MKSLVLGIAVSGVIALSAQVLASPTAPTHTQMMKSCMIKQKAENSKMPAADIKKFCTDTIKEQSVSSGPQSGTLDMSHQ